MYFSDEINLVKRDYVNNKPIETCRSIFCDITSITGTEDTNARQTSIKAAARIKLYSADYDGETLVDYSGGRMLAKGRYSVYRTYFDNDFVELYLEKRRGGQK